MNEARDRPTESIRLWRAGSREIVLDRPVVVGILNVTPDSFSDGGNFFVPEAAMAHAEKMISEGADIIDIGGESTRPGARVVRVDEETRRVAPIVRAVRERWPHLPISIDTTKASVALEAVSAGADIVNDVSGMRLDGAMPALVASTGCGVIMMHSRGSVTEMATYAHADYGEDPVQEMIGELLERTSLAIHAGVDGSRIVIDPGFGFSKRSEHSIAALRDLDRFAVPGFPVMAGVSRKRFITEIAGGPDATLDDRDAATVAACVVALARGAMLFRVHNVRASRRALDVAWAAMKRAQVHG